MSAILGVGIQACSDRDSGRTYEVLKNCGTLMGHVHILIWSNMLDSSYGNRKIVKRCLARNRSSGYIIVHVPNTVITIVIRVVSKFHEIVYGDFFGCTFFQ